MARVYVKKKRKNCDWWKDCYFGADYAICMLTILKMYTPLWRDNQHQHCDSSCLVGTRYRRNAQQSHSWVENANLFSFQETLFIKQENVTEIRS